MSEEKKERPIIEAREKGPGPGRYALPSTCGYTKHDYTKTMKPAYYFGQRLYSKPYEASPGPIHYYNSRVTRHGHDGTPSYSVLGRQSELLTFKTPSPGAYCPEKVHPPGERHAPTYSISARTRFRKKDSNPASNRYTLPPILGSGQPSKRSYPSYSMMGRSYAGSYCEDLSKTPGPGQYNAVEPNAICVKQPQYSLQGRSRIPGDSTQKPGPGTYSPEKVNINKPAMPRPTLGVRHSEFVTPIFIDT